MKPKHIFTSPGKTELKKSTPLSLSFWAYKACINSKVEHSSLPYLQRNFIFKCCHDLCAMWQIMQRVYLKYLYQYMTKFKSFFCGEINRIIVYVFLNYKQLPLGEAEKMPWYTVYNLPHRAQVMTTFKNEIPLKTRQGTVFHFRIYTNFVWLKL